MSWLFVVLPSWAETSWHVLRSPEAEASSHLKSNWNKYEEDYHPTYVLDENPATAWVEGAEGDGLGEWIRLPLSALSQARSVRLKVRNGYQKSDALLTANAAPKDVTVELLQGERVVATKKAVLARQMGWQEIVVAVPAGRGLDGVRMRIDSVTPGRSYKDTCVSDLLVEVDSDVPYAERAEAGKRAAALAWMAQRLETARQFAAGGYSTPFSATSYRCDPQPELPAAALEAKLASARTWKAQIPASGPTFRADPTATIPTPDHAWDFERIGFLLKTDLTAFFEAPADKGRMEQPTEDTKAYWSGRQWTAFRLKGPPTAPELGFARTHEVYTERGTTVVDAEWTFAWTQGRLSGLFVTTGNDDGSRGERLIVPHWTEAGTLDRWEGWSRWDERSECDQEVCTELRHWVCVGI
jgi:hypothetical protein